MLRCHVLLSVVVLWCAPVKAQNKFVVDIKIERSDGTSIPDAEVTVYRRDVRLDHKQQETHRDGHYRFDLDVGNPVNVKIEYVKELNKKYWPHNIWSLSGRKQLPDGHIPVVLTTTEETKTPLAWYSALGHVEGAYRLINRSQVFAQRRVEYEGYLDELANAWQQPEFKAELANNSEEYNLFGGKLNTLATEFRRGLPVVSSGMIAFPVVKNTAHEPEMINYFPELPLYTVVNPWYRTVGLKNQGKYEALWRADSETPGKFDYSAAVDNDGMVTVFVLNSGHIESLAFTKDGKRTEQIGGDETAIHLFVAPDGKTIATTDASGKLVFNNKSGESWSKSGGIARVPSFDSWAFSADGKKFATSSGTFVNGRVSVYEIAQGRLIKSLAIPEGASGVAFDNDGTDLYISSRAQGKIRKYDFKTDSLQSQEELVPSMLGPLGWDAKEQKLYAPTTKGEIKSIPRF